MESRETVDTAGPAAGEGPCGGDVSFTITTCRRDVHYAKASVASVRHFYPDHAIHVICDADVPRRDLRQLASVPGLSVHPVERLTERTKVHLRGLLSKLYLLLIPEVARTVFVDADSVLVGPALEAIDTTRPLVPLVGSWKDLDDPADRVSFDEWQYDTTKIAEIDPGYTAPRRVCWMSTSNFYVDAGRFPVHHLFRLLPHLNTRRSERVVFREDQGFVSYVANSEWVDAGWLEPRGDCVVEANPAGAARVRVSLDEVLSGGVRGPYFLHYVGGSRRHRLVDHHFGDVLLHFYREFYRRFAPGQLHRDELVRYARMIPRAVNYGAKKITGRV